jgi:hypothetical protein
MVNHVKQDQLYPFYHLMSLHHQKKKTITGLGDMPEELQKTLERLDNSRFAEPPAEEHGIKVGKVKEIIAHLNDCEDCQVTLYEDGPGANRARGKDDKAMDLQAEEDRIAGLKRTFFISAGYSIPCVIGARMVMTEYHKRKLIDPFPGFWAESLSNEMKAKYNLKKDGFASIVKEFKPPNSDKKVDMETNASRSGLKKGDIICAVKRGDGQYIETNKDALNAAIHIEKSYLITQVITLKVLRGKKELEVSYPLRSKMQLGPSMVGKKTAAFQLDPLQILAFSMVFIGAWGLVQCWTIANEVWIDWSKAKEAVPVIGKSWAEKGRKKKAEEDQERRRAQG